MYLGQNINSIWKFKSYLFFYFFIFLLYLYLFSLYRMVFVDLFNICKLLLILLSYCQLLSLKCCYIYFSIIQTLMPIVKGRYLYFTDGMVWTDSYKYL